MDGEAAKTVQHVAGVCLVVVVHRVKVGVVEEGVDVQEMVVMSCAGSSACGGRLYDAQGLWSRQVQKQYHGP